jgi:hypothetical protein
LLFIILQRNSLSLAGVSSLLPAALTIPSTMECLKVTPAFSIGVCELL